MGFKDITDVPMPLPPTYEDFIKPIFVKKPYMILLSFNPQWVNPIELGEKLFEFRNRIGKLWKPGLTVLLYITKNHGGSGKIEYSFEIENIFEVIKLLTIETKDSHYHKYQIKSMLTNFIFEEDAFAFDDQGYTNQKYAIGITNFKKLIEPLDLGEFEVNKAPQSWQYLFEGRNY